MLIWSCQYGNATSKDEGKNYLRARIYRYWVGSHDPWVLHLWDTPHPLLPTEQFPGLGKFTLSDEGLGCVAAVELHCGENSMSGALLTQEEKRANSFPFPHYSHLTTVSTLSFNSGNKDSQGWKRL